MPKFEREPNSYVQMTVRMPLRYWRGLRQVAGEQNWSVNHTLIRAVRRWLRENGVKIEPAPPKPIEREDTPDPLEDEDTDA